MPQTIYLALIGDVVGSRQVADRAGLQQRIEAAIRDVNGRYQDRIAASFVLTVGDEFQGLLTTAGGLARIMATLRVAAFPASLRYGIGVGTLTTPLQPQAIGMDGPCFHRARAAIEQAEQAATRVEVEAPSGGAAFMIYATLSSAVRRQWTDRQRQVHELAMSGETGKSIAARLGVSPSAVSQHLKAANHDAVEAASRVWESSIQSAMEATE